MNQLLWDRENLLCIIVISIIHKLIFVTLDTVFSRDLDSNDTVVLASSVGEPRALGHCEGGTGAIALIGNELRVFAADGTKKEYSCAQYIPSALIQSCDWSTVEPDLFLVSTKSGINKYQDLIRSVAIGSSEFSLSTLVLTAERPFLPPIYNNKFLVFEKLKLKMYTIKVPGSSVSHFFSKELTCAQALLFTSINHARIAGKQLRLSSFLQGTYNTLQRIINKKFKSQVAEKIINALEQYVIAK